jgi:hypothetical protein
MINTTKDMISSSITTTIKTTTTTSNNMITVNKTISSTITTTHLLYNQRHPHLKMKNGATVILLEAERKKW